MNDEAGYIRPDVSLLSVCEKSAHSWTLTGSADQRGASYHSVKNVALITLP